MRNISKLLAELNRQRLISPEVESFLRNFFMSRMNLTCDIQEADIASAIREVAAAKFGSGMGLGDRFLTANFKPWAPTLLAEAALSGVFKDTLDISRILLVFVLVNDRTMTAN